MTNYTNQKAGVMTDITTSREIPKKDIGLAPGEGYGPAMYDRKRLNETTYQLGEDHTSDDTVTLSLTAVEGDGFGRILTATAYVNHDAVEIRARRITDPDSDYTFISVDFGPVNVYLSEEQWATMKNQEV